MTRLGCGNVTVRGMAFSSPQNPPTPPGGGSIARPGTVAEASPSAGWSSSGLLGPPYHLPANLPTAPQSRVAMGTRTEGVSSGRAGPPCKGGGTRALVTASLHSPQIRGRAVDAISRQRYRSYNCPRADLSGGLYVAGYCVAGGALAGRRSSGSSPARRVRSWQSNPVVYTTPAFCDLGMSSTSRNGVGKKVSASRPHAWIAASEPQGAPSPRK